MVRDERKQVAVDRCRFEVRAGEILGVAGVQGNGQTELVEALTGLRPAVGGQITLAGTGHHRMPRRARSPSWARRMCPEDRQRDGLVLTFPVADNLVLNTYYQPPFAQGRRAAAESHPGECRTA